MATDIQILLPLICVVLAEGYVLDPSRPHHGHLHLSKKPHDTFDPYDPLALKQPADDDRPINGDIFSYNNQHAYNHFYHDGSFNPLLGLNPYFGYPGPYGNMGNFDHMPGLPFGIPNIHNEFNMPGQGLPNYINGMGGDNNPDSKEDPTEMNNGNPNEQHGENQQPGAKKDKNVKPSDADHMLEDMPPKTNKIKKDETDKGKKEDDVNLNPKKDFLLVDNNGNNVYLLHENAPNTNAVVLPNNNQVTPNNVVYVPYNPQQPGNQVYQVVNGQPAVSTNVPVIASRQDFSGYNNGMATPVQSSPPLNNNNPSYVLIYANGQLIQVPGVVINSQQNNAPLQNGNQGSNVMIPNTVSMPNVMYANPSNQGNNPMYVQMPNVAPVSNNVPSNGIVMQNPQPVANPNVMPDNTMGAYGAGNKPNSVAIPTNMVNGYAQPNMQPNGNQGSMENPLPPTPINNQAVPAYALPVDNNQNMYSQPSPSQEKDANGVASTPNDVPASNSQPQPATQSPDLNNNGVNLSDTLGAQPAIMVSGFKETDGGDDKDKKKENKDQGNKDKENKDKKKKDEKKDKKKK